MYNEQDCCLTTGYPTEDCCLTTTYWISHRASLDLKPHALSSPTLSNTPTIEPKMSSTFVIGTN